MIYARKRPPRRPFGHDRPREVISLPGDGVLENLGYRQWKTLQAWRGLVEYLRGVESWGAMERAGFRDA